MNYPNQNNPNPFGNVMGSYPVQQQGYPQQQGFAAPNQTMSGFAQQQSMYGVAPQQPQQQSVYPQWFAQQTGIDPVYMDQTIINSASQLLGRIVQSGLGQRIGYSPQIAATPLQFPEMQQLFPMIRQVAIIFVLGQRGLTVNQAVEKAVSVVLLGNAVQRLGGPNAPDLQQWNMVMNTDLMGFFNNYMQICNDPQMYAKVVNAVSQRLVQQAAPMGSGFGGFPANAVNPNAIPNQAFGYTQGAAFPAQPQQAVTDPISMIGRVAGSGTNPQTASTVDIYSLANKVNKGQTAEPAKPQAQPIASDWPNQIQPSANQPSVEIEGVNPDVQITRVSGGERTVIDPYSFLMGGNKQQAQAPAQQPQAQTQPVVDNQPKSVLPTGWGNPTQEPTPAPTVAADEVAQPTRDYETPPEGLPSVGFYNFQAGQPTEMSDFNTPATTDQHTANAPHPASTFEDEVGEDDDAFYADTMAIEEAEIQAQQEYVRRNENPLTPIDSMDQLLDQAREEGHEVKDPELRLDYMALDKNTRTNICRKFKLRVVPAYVKGEQHLIHISQGTRREIIINRVDEVDYNTHETEAHKTQVFASWDEEARNVQLAKSAMQATVDQPKWSEKYFLEQLEEKLAEDEQAEADAVLGSLVADRQVIEIEDIVISRSAANDHQTAIIDELVSRGVEQAGTLVDNAVVKYERFESTCLVLNEENKQLIETVVKSDTATTVIESLDNFKRNSTLPLREIARILQVFTQQVNRYLITELATGWVVDDALEDFKELQKMAVRLYEDEDGTNEILNRVYVGAAQYALSTAQVGDEESIGHTSIITLLPFYYSQYPIAFADEAGAVLKADHPELYELLNKLNEDSESAEVKLVTLDNVVLTFLRSLGEDGLYFLVDIKK